MYADEFVVKIVSSSPDAIYVNSGGELLERFAGFVPLQSSDVPLDRAIETAMNAFYDASGPYDGVAFRINGEYVSQGGDGAGVELIIEMLSPLKNVSWAVLGGLILKALTDALSEDKD